MTSKAGKRPLRSLTAHEKLEAIRRVHDGESKASVARDIGVPESTLRGWCKNEDKISYLSRQSSPETEDEPKDKKIIKLDEPYNLSKKSALPTAVPTTTAVNVAPVVVTSNVGSSNGVASPDKPLNLNVKTSSPSDVAAAAFALSERERNRAELARLSVELGLNRPEMFLPSLNSNMDLALLAQWNSLLVQQHQKAATKVTTAPADSSNAYQQTPPRHQEEKKKKEKPALDESVWYWLKQQPGLLMASPNNGPVVTTASSSTPTPPVATTTPSAVEHNSSWFWKWYKQFANSYPLPQTADKPILYQQLTKDVSQSLLQPVNTTSHVADALVNGTCKDNAENIVEKQQQQNKNNTKARAVLDNLLFNNNNNNNVDKKPKDQNEALEHGEKFLEWLECCSEPCVTAVQILQFRSLLNNIRNGSKNNGDVNKTKVKRK